MHLTLSLFCRERRQEFFPPGMWPSNSPDLNPVDYSIWGVCPSREGLPFADPRCEGVERTSAEWVWRLLDHTIISWQWLHSGIVVWMHVFAWMVDILNINFEPLIFCCVLFVWSILVSVNVIDINMCKVLILYEMCYTFVSETFTRYGSNITNVWQDIFAPMTLAFSCEVVHEKLWKSVNICESYSKKISGTFFLDTLYSVITMCIHFMAK